MTHPSAPLSAFLETPRLGVNVDHIATVRNARGGAHPDPIRAAKAAIEAGADGITMHLREDRRHIVDEDIRRAVKLPKPLNLEMAATEEMQAIALSVKPNAVCLVPEKREERTTEGGLDAEADTSRLSEYVKPLRDAGIRISLFIEPEPLQIRAATQIGADIVEFHTGPFAHAHDRQDPTAVVRSQMTLAAGAATAHAQGLEVHFGHGLTTANVGGIAAIREAAEFNIGHYLIGEAMFIGLGQAIADMRAAIDKGRTSALPAHMVPPESKTESKPESRSASESETEQPT